MSIVLRVNGVLKAMKPHQMISDFITGKRIPNIGTEEIRQAVERYLVEEKGYQKQDIEVDAPIEIEIQGEMYRSVVDLVVCVQGDRFMAIKCAAGSLDSWSRETVSASRLLHRFQLPISVVSDGKTAIILDTISGKKMREGMKAIPSCNEAIEMIEKYTFQILPEDRADREKLIFRSYDSMKVNTKKNIAGET